MLLELLQAFSKDPIVKLFVESNSVCCGKQLETQLTKIVHFSASDAPLLQKVATKVGISKTLVRKCTSEVDIIIDISTQ